MRRAGARALEDDDAQTEPRQLGGNQEAQAAAGDHHVRVGRRVAIGRGQRGVDGPGGARAIEVLDTFHELGAGALAQTLQGEVRIHR